MASSTVLYTRRIGMLEPVLIININKHLSHSTMFSKTLAVCSATLLAATCTRAQNIGTWQTETHPKLDWKQCSSLGASACETVQGELTIDANWRWAHDKTEGSWYSCVQYAQWNVTLCPDGRTCTKNCAIDGGQYKDVYGVTTSSDVLKMKYVTYLDFCKFYR
jgi:cellulose 1,4-beta-cellobiosidase